MSRHRRRCAGGSNLGSCSPHRRLRGRRPLCCSPLVFSRPAIGGSLSGGYARRSGSRAARSGSTCGCAKRGARSLDRVGKMPVSHMILIALAGVGAGAINAVVGSGTLITFPTLVALGYPPVTSTMSNAVGLVAGGVSATWGYRDELGGQWDRLRWQIPASLTGAALGAFLLLHLPEQV